MKGHVEKWNQESQKEILGQSFSFTQNERAD